MPANMQRDNRLRRSTRGMYFCVRWAVIHGAMLTRWGYLIQISVLTIKFMPCSMIQISVISTSDQAEDDRQQRYSQHIWVSLQQCLEESLASKIQVSVYEWCMSLCGCVNNCVDLDSVLLACVNLLRKLPRCYFSDN